MTVPLPSGREPDSALAHLGDHVLLSPYTDAAAPVIIELVDASTARVQATPVHPDESDELRSDLLARATTLATIPAGQ